MNEYSVRMPVGFGKRGIKSKGRPLSVMPHLSKSIIEVKTVDNCLAHALIMPISKADKDPNYESYRHGCKIRPVVRNLLNKTGIGLYGDGRIPEIVRFQEHIRDYKISVYQGVACEDVMFKGQVDFHKRINLLYDDFERHYHVIKKLTVAIARPKFVKRVTKGVEETLRMCVTKRVATAWRARYAGSKEFEFPATNATGNLEVARVSTTTSRIPRRKNSFMNAVTLRYVWRTRDARKKRI